MFIPNEEIRREFVNALRGGGRPGLARLARESRELLRATVEGDAVYVADALGRAHSWAAGPRYYNDEQALRAAVKFAYVAAADDYLRIDELPGGRGFADVVFVPKPGSPLPPMVVELKWNKPVKAAVDQVKRRDYPAALSGLGGECVLVGITYDEGTTAQGCRLAEASRSTSYPKTPATSASRRRCSARSCRSSTGSSAPACCSSPARPSGGRPPMLKAILKALLRFVKWLAKAVLRWM